MPCRLFSAHANIRTRSEYKVFPYGRIRVCLSGRAEASGGNMRALDEHLFQVLHAGVFIAGPDFWHALVHSDVLFGNLCANRRAQPAWTNATRGSFHTAVPRRGCSRRQANAAVSDVSRFGRPLAAVGALLQPETCCCRRLGSLLDSAPSRDFANRNPVRVLGLWVCMAMNRHLQVLPPVDCVCRGDPSEAPRTDRVHQAG